MKIIKFSAENFKRLAVVEITPDGNIVQITGRNGSGKSSILDAIFAALAGKTASPGEPVRKGADKATIRLDLGEVVVTRKFTTSGTTTLTVEGTAGAKFPSPQKMLDDLIGSLSFDPLAFTRMKPAEQLDQLRGMVKVEVDIDALDAANKADYDSRTEINRRAKDLNAQAAAIIVQPDLPAEPVDVDSLLAEMEGITKFNAGLDQRRKKREEVAAGIVKATTEATNARAKAIELRAEADELDKNATALESQIATNEQRLKEAPPLPAEKVATEISAQIQAAGVTNQHIAARARRLEIENAIKMAENQAIELTAEMNRRIKQRAEAIAAAEMPVEGLSFGDGMVLYNELPFDQASGAEQLRVSVAIAMAMNPKLRVLRIKDGSLLDENGLRLVAEMAEKNDVQVWVESVNTSGTMGIVMEDGAVIAVNESISKSLNTAEESA